VAAGSLSLEGGYLSVIEDLSLIVFLGQREVNKILQVAIS